MTEQEYAADEIDLRDYINVIIKRKKLILAVFIASVVIGAIIAILSPKVYEVSADMQLGSINNLLITKEEAREAILSDDLLTPVIKETGIKRDLELFKKVIKIEDIKNTNLVGIKIRYHNADMALTILKKIATEFIAQFQPLYEKNEFLVKERLSELDSEIIETNKSIEIKQVHLKELADSINHSNVETNFKAFLMQNYIPTYQQHLFSLRNEKKILNAVLVNSKNFQLLNLSPKPKYPIAPNKKLNVFLAAAIGLILGVFLAFFLEYWRSYNLSKQK